MARTDKDNVKVIIDTNISDSDVTSFIDDANVIVDNRLSGEDVDDDILTMIEKYLTAHLISVSRERQATDEKVGDVSVKYSGSFSKFLEMTSYGQEVLILDPTGKMASASKRKAYIRSINPDRETWD